MANGLRNDVRQYDELRNEWWNPRGPFAMLQWIAKSRADLVPVATHKNARLLDMACGGGLLAPHVTNKGYTHVGVDMTESALMFASDHGVTPVRGDVAKLPFADECFDVVCAGEILEHVTDLGVVMAESARVLKPGGTLVIDTIANTVLARFLTVTVAERIPGGAPPGIHDPKLFVERKYLVSEYARHGVDLTLQGLRPSLLSILAWQSRMSSSGRMLPTRWTAVLFQAWGTKA